MSRILKATNQLEDDVSKANIFVHGDEDATYTAKDGTKVRSIRNLQKEAEVNIEDAKIYAASANDAAERAEAAKGGAFVNADIFSSINEGISAVNVGDQFQVLSNDGYQYIRYEKESESKSKEVARFLSGNIDASTVNMGKIFPLKKFVRDGVISNDGTGRSPRDVFLDIKVIAPKEDIEGKYFRLAYMQNGASLSHGVANGVRIEEFNIESYSTNSEAIIIHASSDEPADYDRDAGGIQTFIISPSQRPNMQIVITLNVDELPKKGTAFMTGNNSTSPYWSWVIDPSCYQSYISYKEPMPKMQYHGKYYPLKKMVREGIESQAHAVFNRVILDIEVDAPHELISTKFFALTYLQNGALLSGKRHNGIRIEMYDRSTYEETGAGVSIHTPQDYPAEYDRELGGIQTFDLICAHDERVKLKITFDVDSLPESGRIVRSSFKGDDAWSWIIDPSCYVSSDIKPIKVIDNSISGALAIGASLISYQNGWFEQGCEKLGIVGINKSVAGQMPQYHADRIYRGTFCTDQEFEDADILVIQYASSKELDDETGLLQYSADYTTDFDINNASNQFVGKYSQAQIFDYIIKYWRERCFAQKDNADSKWYGTKFGKPFRVVFVTHWHDSRDYYNIPIRNLAKKWGGVVCAFDEKIGFTKNTPMPDGTQVSLLYAMDSQTIGGVLYGWHPSRGQEGEYIQKTMSNIFAETIIQNYM